MSDDKYHIIYGNQETLDEMARVAVAKQLTHLKKQMDKLVKEATNRDKKIDKFIVAATKYFEKQNRKK